MIAAIHLVRLTGDGDHGALPQDIVEGLSGGLARSFGVNCPVLPAPFHVGFAADPVRNQYYSTSILARLGSFVPAAGNIVLGVTEFDLFVPVLTFVFGEAQLSGPCALVSSHRLREEFYGLPPNEKTLLERLLKEALHEIGHTQGLRHCRDWLCAMASSHAVERLDIKEPAFCAECAARFG